MAVLNRYSLLFADYAALAEVTVQTVEKIYLVVFFCYEPFMAGHCSVFSLLGPAAGLKGIEVVVEVVVPGLDASEIVGDILLGNFLIFDGEVYLSEIDVIVSKGDHLLALEK